jgi:uncharacterized protein
MSWAMELTVVQQRVLGSLIEKDLLTPDVYPLSMNSLLAACNQATSRDPVLDLDVRTVENALENLKAEGLARVVYMKGMRVDKYRHVAHERWSLDRPGLAILAVMLLRGPQTVAELRSRTERMVGGQDVAIDDQLVTLSERSDPLVTVVPRQPGQKEVRWRHLLGRSGAGLSEAGSSAVAAVQGAGRPDHTTEQLEAAGPASLADRVEALEAEVAELRRIIGDLSG